MTQKSSNKGMGAFRAKGIKLKTARGRTNSSQRWLSRQLNDPFVQMAQKKGYRSRAAFKIQEIQNKYRIIKPGQVVIDLGAAPGGWTQALLEMMPSLTVIGIDLLEVEPIAGATFIQGDFLDEGMQKDLETMLKGKKADAVLSDMAASTTGHSQTDHIRTEMLADIAFHFAQQVLVEGGSFVAKVFNGGTHQTLLDLLKKRFKVVKHFKPESSRKESPELYVVCTGFRL